MGNGEMKLNRYPKYKPTGIAWLPEVPEGWEVRRLKYAITSLRKGKGITKDDVFDDGDLPCVRYGEIYSKYDSCFDVCISKTRVEVVAKPQYFEKGDILFSCTGELVEEIGKNIVYCGEGRCAAGGDIIVISHNQEPKFLNYYLGSYPTQRQKSYGKAKLKVVHIHALDIQNLVTLLPPLPTQRAIVAFLDEKCGKVDRLVAAKEREVALLKELKQAMIAEAVTGATHVARTDTARKMKPSGIPWLPEVPEGWEVKRLKGLFSLRRESYSPNEQLQVLSLIKDVGVIPYEEKGQLGNKSKEDISGYNVARKGDIVMNSMNVIIGSVDITPFDGYISPAYYALTARQGVEPKYFNYLFHLTLVQKMMRSLAKGILEIRLRISITSLLGMSFPVPPLAEQRAIVAYIEARAAKIDAAVAGLEREVAAMKEYKQRLIADVVTGQRKVA